MCQFFLRAALICCVSNWSFEYQYNTLIQAAENPKYSVELKKEEDKRLLDEVIIVLSYIIVLKNILILRLMQKKCF